jgi:hypothetical protein
MITTGKKTENNPCVSLNLCYTTLMFNQNRNDNIVVRPAPTPKRTSLTPEELAKIERRVEALRPRPLTEQEKAKLAHIKRCS